MNRPKAPIMPATATTPLPEEVLMDTGLIRMSAEGFEAFLSALAAPAVAVPELVELARRTAPWEIAVGDTLVW